MPYQESIRVERRAADHYRLSWQPALNAVPTAITVSLTPTSGALAADISIAADGADIRQLPAAARHFFHVTLSDGRRLLLAERRLALQESPNFRDFGGYATRDGKRIRWGQLYRSGQLDRVADSDQQQIAALGIKLVCDFRRDSEREHAPNRFAAGHAPRIENLPITPGSRSDAFARDGGKDFLSRESLNNAAQLMLTINRDLALKQTSAYTGMFKALVESEGPILIHCAVGKDRTGFAAALIQAALGVPEPALLHDYLLTDRYLSIALEMAKLQALYQWRGATAQLLPILQVRREYFYAAFDAINESFGSIDVYLREALGVDAAMLEQLRARWLE